MGKLKFPEKIAGKIATDYMDGLLVKNILVKYGITPRWFYILLRRKMKKRYGQIFLRNSAWEERYLQKELKNLQ